MEVLIGLFALGCIVVVVVLPLVALARLGAQRARLDRLEWELNRLSQHVRDLRRETSPDAHDAGSVVATAEPAPAPSSPGPVPIAAPAPAVVAAATSDSGVGRAPASVTPAPPGPRPAPEPQPSRARMDAAGLEQLIGGVWLQNLGAVLLLVGVFLMILWGYTSGRLGAPALIAAGIATGLGFVWRGDRVARRVPAFGHALIGIGFGIVYLTLHLGYVRLHVLPAWLAFALLVAVSVVTMLAGLHYRVALIAGLGVIGAFLPQFLAGWMSLEGFQLPAPALLGYLAAINLLVFSLAARAGWSGLDLSAVVLTALAWAAATGGARWGWGTQLGLAGLFTLLGVAPLPRLVGAEGRVRAMDLAVIAVTPLALLFASHPFLWHEARPGVAMLLLGTAAAYLGAALWVDARRPERDLWVPLTGAATLFVTAAVERAAGREYAAIAWGVEGLLLLGLGLRDGGGWLRLWGTIVIALGTLVTIARVASGDWDPAAAPVLHAPGVRALAVVAVLLVGADLLERGRRHLSDIEGALPGLWLAMGHALLFVWGFAEAGHTADAIARSRTPGAAGSSPDAVRGAFTALAWSAQAAWLLVAGSLRGRGMWRLGGYALGALGAFALLVTFAIDRAYPSGHPILHLTGVLPLLTIALIATTSGMLARGREGLAAAERRAPELGAVVAAVALAGWGLREAGHLAHALATIPPRAIGIPRLDEPRFRALAAAFTSAFWLAEAGGLLVLGWLRGSAFLRWCALALLGVTLLRFVVVDLQTVDVFWRFLTAIVVGAAMLAMSYAYQRRLRAREHAR